MPKPKPKPYVVLIENWEALQLARASNSTLKGANDALKAAGNPIGEVPFNSTKSLIPAMEALDSARADAIANLTNELAAARDTIANLTNELAAARDTIANLTNELAAAGDPITPTNTETNEGAQVITRGEAIRLFEELIGQRALNAKPKAPREKAPAAPKAEGVPRQIAGWSITYTRGYYKASRRSNGKAYAVHLGKIWDEVKAAEKIAGFEAKRAIKPNNEAKK